MQPPRPLRPATLANLAVLCLLCIPQLLQAGQGGWGIHPEPDGGWSVYRDDRIQLQPTLELQAAGFWEKNPWLGESRAVIGDNADAWGEGSMEAGLTGTFSLASRGTLEARYSYLGAWTRGGIDAAGSNFPDETAESGLVEDLYLRWRSGELLSGLGEDALELSFGRQDYRVGSGFLFWDGATSGGSRGAYWLGPRSAFELAAIARLKTGPLTSEAVYLSGDERPDEDTRMAGVNFEWDFETLGSAGLGYYRIHQSDDDELDGLWLIDARARLTPFSSLPHLSLSGEYVFQKNSGRLEAHGYYGELGYAFEERAGQPVVSYRFALFSGDKSGGSRNEGFKPLFYGGSDWGTWIQGEILGHYVVTNQNLLTHTVRIGFTPHRAVAVNLLYFHQRLVERTDSIESQVGTRLTDVDSKHLGDELDLAVDWTVNSWLSLTSVGAVLFPGAALREGAGNDADWGHFMLWAVVSF
jgi:hypothetical protein